MSKVRITIDKNIPFPGGYSGHRKSPYREAIETLKVGESFAVEDCCKTKITIRSAIQNCIRHQNPKTKYHKNNDRR